MINSFHKYYLSLLVLATWCLTLASTTPLSLTNHTVTPTLPPDPLKDCQLDKVGPGLLVIYIIGIGYSFIGIGLVCDTYFVTALELMADGLGFSMDVAGATLMAAGGSAPELATSFIGTFEGSSVGFNTIVGSAVFNVLFVIACCVLFQKKVMRLSRWPLMRDCSYYTLSLITLSLFFKVISPNKIEWWEAGILFGLYLLYVFMMSHNERLLQWAIKKGIVPDEEHSSYAPDPDPTPTAPATTNAPNSTYTFRAGFLEWLTKSSDDWMEGISYRVVTMVEGDVHQTFQEIDEDGNGHIDQSELTKLLRQFDPEITDEKAIEIYKKIDLDGNGEINEDEFTIWYLASETRLKNDKRTIFNRIASKSEGDGLDSQDVEEFLRIIDPDQTLDYRRVQEEFGVENGPITYEQFDTWFQSSILYQTAQQRQQLEADTKKGVDLSFPKSGLRSQIGWVLTIPMLFCFYLTIPDPRTYTPAHQKYIKNVTFLISIIWIGFISYWMVDWAGIVGNTIGIPINVMGLTVLAMGTSVPDLMSSVIVARQGEADMAVSSSIGSNIFDILVGLPLPWLTKSLVDHIAGKDSAVKVEADNLGISLPILIGMLVIVFGSIHYCGWETKRPLAYMMFIFYLLFVAQDLARSEWGC